MSELWAHVEELTKPGAITLSSEEARHVGTRRLRVGDGLVVFDGRGRVAEGRLESVEKRAAVVSVEVIREVPPLESGFVLASAIPKGDRLSTMLQMLSQLGLVTWQPLVLDDSAVRKLDHRAPRLNRILLESCKVARRPWALEIRAPLSLDEAIAASTGPIYFGDQQGGAQLLDSMAALLLIGPEAGFSDREHRALVEAGAEARSLGRHNLRIETAAIAAATAYHLSRSGMD